MSARDLIHQLQVASAELHGHGLHDEASELEAVLNSSWTTSSEMLAKSVARFGEYNCPEVRFQAPSPEISIML